MPRVYFPRRIGLITWMSWHGTFLGTSKRFFIRGMKDLPITCLDTATPRKWSGIFLWRKISRFSCDEKYGIRWTLYAVDGRRTNLCYGRRKLVLNLSLPGLKFQEKNISLVPFTRPRRLCLASASWFFYRSRGKPIKACATDSLGKKQGELMITKYGLEGSPIYGLGKRVSHIGSQTRSHLEKVRRKNADRKKQLDRIWNTT